jgi:hypothetical protein
VVEKLASAASDSCWSNALATNASIARVLRLAAPNRLSEAASTPLFGCYKWPHTSSLSAVATQRTMFTQIASENNYILRWLPTPWSTAQSDASPTYFANGEHDEPHPYLTASWRNLQPRSGPIARGTQRTLTKNGARIWLEVQPAPSAITSGATLIRVWIASLQS